MFLTGERFDTYTAAFDIMQVWIKLDFKKYEIHGVASSFKLKISYVEINKTHNKNTFCSVPKISVLGREKGRGVTQLIV